MRRGRSYCLALSSLLALLWTTASVRADFVTATLQGGSLTNTISPGAWVNINDGKGGAASDHYYPGMVNWTTDGSSVLGPSGTHFTTFCIELTQNISPGDTYTYKIQDLASSPTPGSSQTGGPSGMGTDKATAIGELWALDYNRIGTNGTDAAAFQLAVWKIEYDWGNTSTNYANGNFFSSGNFRASGNSAAIDQANTWLSQFWNNDSYITPASGLVALSNPNYQDQLVQTTPAPAGLTLACIGGVLLALWGYRRRRRIEVARA